MDIDFSPALRDALMKSIAEPSTCGLMKWCYHADGTRVSTLDCAEELVAASDAVGDLLSVITPPSPTEVAVKPASTPSSTKRTKRIPSPDATSTPKKKREVSGHVETVAERQRRRCMDAQEVTPTKVKPVKLLTAKEKRDILDQEAVFFEDGSQAPWGESQPY